ncbi:MAG: 5-carboxymethyl-2-hydroxymuconate isomerase [Alphaproteobacteria bacterium PA2]|nr:MAG: 5-carboxymethyl-2-hydroxymuconate isomerase [Alphaproteobacteria bacterium PA2]
MQICTYLADQGPRVGVVANGQVIDAGFDGSMIDLISQWPQVRGRIEAAVAAGSGKPLGQVQLLAPVPRPGKVFAIGLNYADHIEESRMETPEHQVWFTKAVTSVTGPYAPVQIPKVSAFVDYEAELVAVIGKGGKHIPAEKAAEHIFGYAVGNDVTERFWQHRTAQWSLGKSFDTHAPFGPWITTTDAVADVHALGIRCLVNGQERQNSNTRHLVFDIFQQIEHLSQAMTLEPGDVIFTGTPGGIGAAMIPRQFLKAGDVVRCEIDGLGHIENTLAPEA